MWLVLFTSNPLAFVASVHVFLHALSDVFGGHAACSGLIVLAKFRLEEGEEGEQGGAGRMGQGSARTGPVGTRAGGLPQRTDP